jgi:formate dehydrogenase major subunit
MPAHDWEVEQALSEGVHIDFLVAPVAIQGTGGRVESIRLIRMKLGAPDKSGRARPEPVAGSEFDLPVDHVILAIGQQTNFAGLDQGLTLTKWGTIQADPVTQQTSIPAVFAGGDAVTGADTVVAAFGAGKRAAESIDRYLSGADLGAGRSDNKILAPACSTEAMNKAPRARDAELPIPERAGNFREVVSVLSEEAARAEAERCLGCGALGECLPGAASCESGHGRAGKRPILDRARMIVLEVNPRIAVQVGGIRIQPEAVTKPILLVLPPEKDDDVIVCRCERVTVAEVRKCIRQGVTDLNQLKAILHIGMGACGSKTCGPLLQSLFRREGVPAELFRPFVLRPLTAEVPMGFFAGPEKGTEKASDK